MQDTQHRPLRITLLISLFLLGGLILGYILSLFLIWSPEEKRAKNGQPNTFSQFFRQYLKALAIVLGVWIAIILLNFASQLA